MEKKSPASGIRKWAKDNLIALVLVAVFIPVYIATRNDPSIRDALGTTSLRFLGHEYYRWFTCIFLHDGFRHIFFNSLALICVGSLISPFAGKWKALLVFILGGALAEVPFSIIVGYSEPHYGGGSSGGIFALIALFLVCFLRFPECFPLRWYRLDLIGTVLFFIFANDDPFSFLTHVFGFTAGIILATVLVLTGSFRRTNT